jgi:hypothetical protein
VRRIVDALGVRDEVDRYVARERDRAREALRHVPLREPARAEVLRLVEEATGAPSPAARA